MDHLERPQVGAVLEDLARVTDILLCTPQEFETEGVDPHRMAHQGLVDRCRKGQRQRVKVH